MISTEAQRTLVKSPPELWAELSDPDSLARHLCDFGEIRIVGVEPESTVAWEAEGVSGAVRLKASGWGTKVTLTAVREAPTPPAPEPVAEPEPVPEATVEPEPVIEPTPQPAPPQPRFFARLFRRRRKVEATLAPESEPELEAQEPEVEVEVEQQDQPDLGTELKALEESMAAETTAVLTGVLDRLGAAHHRPFSRA